MAENFTAIKEIWFAMSVQDRFDFISSNIMIQNPKGDNLSLMMTEFQKRWFLKGPLFNDFTKMTKFENRISLKCRGIGASYVMIAVEATLTCWVYPNVFIPLISTREDQANDIIKSCKRVIKYAHFNIPLEITLENQTQFSLRFANGSLIKSFAGGNPEGIRGGRALCAYLDEFAFVQKAQEVMTAVEYFLNQGGQLSILSTPYGRQNLYWKIWSDRDNFKGWSRHLVSLFENMDNFDVAVPLPVQIKQYGLKLTAPWLNLDFLEKKRQEDAPNNFAFFLQESVGVPMDEVTAAITEAVLDAASMDYYEVAEATKRAPEEIGPEQIFVIGMDFGGDSNMTAVDVEEAIDGKFITCHTEQFRGNFVEQVEKVKTVVAKFRPKYIVCDATGMGGKAWVDLLADILEGDMIIIAVNYSKKDIAEENGVDMTNKIFFVNNAIKLMAQGLAITPKNHKRLREELLGMEKIVYEKTIKYSGKNGIVGSDDLAFAKLQALIVFNKIFDFGESESTDAYDNGAQMDRKYYKGGIYSPPRIMKAENSGFVEAAGQPARFVERITGFEKLI